MLVKTIRVHCIYQKLYQPLVTDLTLGSIALPQSPTRSPATATSFVFPEIHAALDAAVLRDRRVRRQPRR
jgi:hypothetical protein